MKIIFALCISALVAGGVVIWNAMRPASQFGTFVGAPETEVTVLVNKPEDFLGKTVLVAGTVREQCRTMGCYFYLHEGKKTLRVDMEEIAMNAPRREGRAARVEGRIMPYGDGYQLFASAVKFE